MQSSRQSEDEDQATERKYFRKALDDLKKRGRKHKAKTNRGKSKIQKGKKRSARKR